VDKVFADFFYEQCAGTYSGHMANVPNNPMFYAMVKAYSGSHDSCYAASKTEFAKFLREIANQWPEQQF